ncbi:MAG TPA: efflux RND transporter periplasmic adaptor subunit [Candidatus Limnocylindrales bacterium]|nr:efflux RND transporter periplasmic adaptor subunit [Candidatus Limnocylindrales bacterium]
MMNDKSVKLTPPRWLKLLKWSSLLLSLLTILLVPAYIFWAIGKHDIQTNPVKSRQAGAPMPVKVYPVKVTTITEEIGASAEVQPSSFAHITSTLVGTRVKAVHVDVGDYVEEGQILFELDQTLLISALKSAEEQVNMTKAKLEEIKQTQSTQHEELVAAVKSAETNVEKTRAKLEELKQTQATGHEELVAAVKSAEAMVEKTKAKLEEVEKTQPTQHEELLANLKKAQDDVESNKAKLEELKQTQATGHEELVAAVKSAEATVEKTKAKLEEVEKTQPTNHEQLLANLKKAQDNVESTKAKLEQTKKTQPTRHDEWVAHLETTKASVISGKSTVQVSEAAVARQKQLTNQSVVSQAALEQAQNALDVARSNYVKSLEDHIIAQNNLKNEEITNKAELSSAEFNYSAALYDLKTVQTELKNEEVTNKADLTQAQSDYTTALEDLAKAQHALVNEEVVNRSALAAAQADYSTALLNLKTVEDSLKNEEFTNNSTLTQARSDYVTALENLLKAQDALKNEEVTNKSAMAQAENDYYTALENLLKSQNALKNEEVTSQADLTSAIFNYTTALQALAKARYDLDNSIVRSPIVGVITERNINPGEIIGGTGGTSLLVIGNIQPAMVVANVAEEKLTSVHLGQTAKVTLDSLPNEVLEGTIVKIEPNTNTDTRTFKAHIRVDNPNRILKPGLSAFARIQNSRTVPTVPKVAIVDSAGKASAFVVGTDSIAQLRYVKVGSAGDGLVEILSGINEGENVVTIGQTLLKDGDKVRIIKDVIN